MSAPPKILIVEHDASDLELLEYELKKGGLTYVSSIVQNEGDYCNALKNFVPDIILSDFSLPQFDGSTAFKLRQQLAADTPFIFVSGNIGEQNSVEYIRNGVTDYALKDKLFTLTTKVQRALKESNEKKQKDKADQERVQSEKRLARAQQIAHIGSWELDLITNVVSCSEEACKIYGLAPDQNKQSFVNLLSFIHPDDLDFVVKKVKESRRSMHNFSFHHRIIQKNGLIRHIYSESRLEYDSNGKPSALYGIAHDVTEIKLAEEERTIIMNDLMQRNKDLEEFAYIVSHNLRAPVANILGAASIWNDSGLKTEEKGKLIRSLDESVKGLDIVVKDLNNILKVKGEINETKEIVRFSELIDDIKVSMKNQIDRNHTQVIYDFCEVDQFLTVKSYLYNIFYSLIFKSIKYSRQYVPGVIEIKSQRFKNKIELTFKDNGIGIDLEKRGEQVFGLYKRFHANIEGKGIGLFMVKTQVETLGGKISVTSEVNKGTEFKIVFQI